MNAEKQQLEKDQLQVHGRLSSHKEATQLLQTELQDSRAQVQDQDDTIQTLRNQLKEAQVYRSVLIITAAVGTFEGFCQTDVSSAEKCFAKC